MVAARTRVSATGERDNGILMRTDRAISVASLRPKAHHFIPVGHLARFSETPTSVPPRRRSLTVYDKRSGRFRRAACGKTAVENDLYTFRVPDLSGVPPDPRRFMKAIFDAANKDPEIEIAKADVEAMGIEAMTTIDAWSTGLRTLAEEERAPLLAYAGLLVAQHPTMMRARSEAVCRQFRTIAEPLLGRPNWVQFVVDFIWLTNPRR